MKGYLEPKKDPKRWVLGAVKPPEQVLQESMDWTSFTPKFEAQNRGFETFNCTGFNTLNALEMIHQRLGQTINYSDRWLGIIAGTSAERGGNDPATVAEAIRLHGLIPEEMLPWNDSLTSAEDYYSFKGLTQEQIDACYKYAEDWKQTWDYRYYEITPTVNDIKEWLKRSPVCVSVNAWIKNGDKFTKNPEDRDNHWTLNIKPQWLIEDSYLENNSPLKELEENYPFGFAMGYHLSLREEVKKNLTLWEKLLLILREQLTQLFAPPVKSVNMNKIEQFAKAIEKYEGYYMGSRSFRNHNPGNLKWANQRLAVGKDKQGFAQFKSYEDGFSTLCTMIENACTGKSKVYFPTMSISKFFSLYAPSGDNNHPDKYAQFVAERVGLLVTDPISKLIS